MYRCIRCIRQLEYQIPVKKNRKCFFRFFRIFFFRLKPHSKPITNFALNYPQIYAISQDRKISKTENGVLILKKSIDPSADPILIQILDEFVIVATEAKQVRILNPETLLCRRILSTNGIPKVTCQFKHCTCLDSCQYSSFLQAMIPLSIHQILLMTSASVDLLDPNWTTTLTFSNTSSRGSLDVRISFHVSQYLVFDFITDIWQRLTKCTISSILVDIISPIIVSPSLYQNHT